MYDRQINADVAQKKLETEKELLGMKAQLGIGGSGGGTTMAVYKMLKQRYPDADDMTLLRIAQNKVSTDLTVDPTTGMMNPMSGALQSNAAMSNAKQTGQNMSDFDWKPRTAGEEERQKKKAQQQGAWNEKATQASNLDTMFSNAENLLKTDAPSGSWLGAGWSNLKSGTGFSDEQTQADSALEALGPAATLNIPRMEGPQSDADRLLYQKAAGDLANKTKARGDRLKAIETIRALNHKYSGGQNWSPDFDPSMSMAPNSNLPPSLPPQTLQNDNAALGAVKEGDFIQPNANPNLPKEGATATNPKTKQRIIFRNGQWVPL